MDHTDQLSRLVGCYASARGQLQTDLRTHDGIGHDRPMLKLPCEELPLWLLRRLADRWTLRLAPFTSDNELPVLLAAWRPATAADRAGRHDVVSEARVAVASALAQAPAPSFLVDAGPIVVAGWRLVTPLKRPAAEAALNELARRLGSVTFTDDLLTIGVPVSGPIRQWADTPPRYIAIVDVDASRHYTLDHLLSSIKESSDVETVTA